MCCIPVVAKLFFWQSLLQSSVSHDLSEIILMHWFAAQKIFCIILNVENSYALKFFWYNFLWWIEASNEEHLFEIKIFCNIINASNFFNTFNASLLNINNTFFKKIEHFWTVA